MIENYDHAVIITDFEKFDEKYQNWDSCQRIINELFHRFMGNRLIKLDFMTKKYENKEYYVIGLLLNPEMVHLNFEKGPKWDSDDGKIFCEIWGGKCESRAFNDGVHACIDWHEGGNVTLRIINFIMREKLGLPAHGPKGGWHQIYSEQFNKFLKRFKADTTDNSMSNVQGALELLMVILMSEQMKKLPVYITDLKPVGSWAKKTNIEVERPFMTIANEDDAETIDHINPVYHVMLLTEANSKWPSDYKEFKLMKICFVHELSKHLSNKYKVSNKILSDGRIDIALQNVVFRCSLKVQKEFLILKRKAVGFKEDDLAINIPNDLKICLRDRYLLEITQYIQNFSVQFGDSFTDTCRLCKQWLLSHHFDLIDSMDNMIIHSYLTTDSSATGWRISEIALELIVASLFLHPNPKYDDYPRSSHCGFLRFLKFMSEFNWIKKPLVVNLNGKFNDDEFAKFSQPFSLSENRHTQLPSMVIRTPLNQHGDYWTSCGPNGLLLKNIQELSKAAYVSARYSLITDSDLQPIFAVDKSRFGVLFHLKSNILKLFDFKKDKKFKNFKKERRDKSIFKRKPFPKDYDNDPIIFLLEEMRSIVGDSAVCTFDRFGSKFIALEWTKNDPNKDFIVKQIHDRCRSFIEPYEGSDTDIPIETIETVEIVPATFATINAKRDAQYTQDPDGFRQYAEARLKKYYEELKQRKPKRKIEDGWTLITESKKMKVDESDDEDNGNGDDDEEDNANGDDDEEIDSDTC